MGKSEFEFDAFISHAVEDKIAIATELCERLNEKGLKIWYSGKILRPGASIEESIKYGLTNSRYFVPILSPTYFTKDWTMKELNGFWYLKGKKFFLPVHLNITPQEIGSVRPELSDIWGINTDKGIDFIVEKLHETITSSVIDVENLRRLSTWKYILGALAIIIFSISSFFILDKPDHPTVEDIQLALHDRMTELQTKINTRVGELNQLQARSVGSNILDSVLHHYKNFKSYYRNAYTLDNGYQVVSAKKHVEDKLNLKVQSITPGNQYGFQSPQIYFHQTENQDRKKQVTYALLNPAPLVPEHTEPIQLSDDRYSIDVSFQNNIRFIEVTLTFARHAKDTKSHEMNILGLKPMESYILEKVDGKWRLTEIHPSGSEGN